MTIHRQYPDKMTGYELNPKKGYFSIIVPEESVNLCDNPSLELDDTNWDGFPLPPASQPTTGRTTNEQRRGAWSFYCTPLAANTQAAAGYLGYVCASNNLHTFSFDFKGHVGMKYYCYAGAYAQFPVASFGPIVYFIGTGKWQRISNHFANASGNTMVMMVGEQRHFAGFEGKTFYVDGMQIEENDHATTYFDGDSNGFLLGEDHYIWYGTPHASESWRSGQARNGGEIVSLKNIGFDVLSYYGLGKIPEKNTIVDLALAGGAEYQRSIYDVREYNIVGSISDVSLRNLMGKRNSIQDLINLRYVGSNQPMTVVYEYFDDCGDRASDTLFLPSVYTGGLEDTVDNLYQERLALNFVMPQPELLVDGDSGTVGDFWSTDAFYYISRREKDSGVGGPWKHIETGLNSYVRTLAESQDGRIYVGGAFTQIRPATNAYRVAYIDEDDTFNVMGASSGLNGEVNIIVIGGDNTVYIGGQFDDVQGGPGGTYDHVIEYDPVLDTYSAVGVGLPSALANGGVYDMAIDPITGYLWAVHTVDSGGNLQGAVSYFDKSAWNLSENWGTGRYAYGIAITEEGTVYAVGEDANAGNVGRVRKLEVGGAWTAVADTTIFDSQVFDVTIGDDGIIYMCGTFTDVVLGYNGQSTVSLGGGLSGGVPGASGLYYYNGSLYVTGGPIYEAGGVLGTVTQSSTYHYISGKIAHYDSFSVWNGSSWVQKDFSLNFTSTIPPASPKIPTAPYFIDRRGREYLCMDDHGFTTSTATAMRFSIFYNLTNDGTAPALPKFEIVDTQLGIYHQYLFWIKNETTGKVLHCYLDFSESENLLIDIANKSISSDIFKSKLSGILPGSDFFDFSLAPGDNIITLFVKPPFAAASTFNNVRIWWNIRHDYESGAMYNE